MGDILRLDKITKRFGSFTANKEICFTLEKGEIHSILGENGAGKSTLMNVLFGLYKPDEGKVFLEDSEVQIESPKQMLSLGVAMVHQHFMLVPTLTVVENVVLGMKKPFYIAKDKIAKKITELCISAGFELDPYAVVSTLSVGQQQRVEIIKALYRNVKILILDEPTAILTPSETEELIVLLKHLSRAGMSVIFISHKLNEVMSLSDRISIIRRGEIVGTVAKADVDSKTLAQLMVGREVIFSVAKKECVSRETVLSLKDVWADCGSEKQNIKSISFGIKAGEILAITGVDGNGQTELVETIMGTRHVKAGEIILLDTDIGNKKPKDILLKGVGYVPGDRHKQALILEESIENNMILECYDQPPFTRRHVMNRKESEVLSEEKIKNFDIRAETTKQNAGSLSGGNQQKIVIARALDKSPKLLVAVFPTRGLDVGAIEFIHSQIIEQRDNGSAILLVSNELDEVQTLGDRIGVMYEGRLSSIYPHADISKQMLGLLMAGKEINDLTE